MKHSRLLSVCMLVAAAVSAGCQRAEVRVGSKADNETVLLAELATLLSRSSGATADHRKQLGGTPVLWAALREGQLDLYPEYTGTISEQILTGQGVRSEEALRARLAEMGIGMSRPLGFDNNYAVGMRAETADALGVRTISDLARKPACRALRFGFSSEFKRRADGWPGLRERYRLPQPEPLSLEHAAAYEGLVSGQIAATDVYTTDAEIRKFNLRVLDDDLHYFPRYSAVYLYRQDFAARRPEALAAVLRLEGRIPQDRMIDLNVRVQDGRPEGEVAATFLTAELGIDAAPALAAESPARRLLRLTGEHLTLVAISLTAAVLTAVPLGVLAAARPRLGQGLLAGAGLIQTVPSLALLVLMIPLPFVGGLGARSAIVALYLYSLLPILRNTVTGLHDIPLSLRESAEGLGLSSLARLRLIELPLASRAILAGIKTSAVINVGTATLGALIGAGGLGELIQEGLRLHDNGLLLQGAVPAALLAILVQGAFEVLERRVVPRGLRLTAGG